MEEVVSQYQRSGLALPVTSQSAWYCSELRMQKLLYSVGCRGPFGLEELWCIGHGLRLPSLSPRGDRGTVRAGGSGIPAFIPLSPANP